MRLIPSALRSMLLLAAATLILLAGPSSADLLGGPIPEPTFLHLHVEVGCDVRVSSMQYQCSEPTDVEPPSVCPVPNEEVCALLGDVQGIIGDLYCDAGGSGLLAGTAPVTVDPFGRYVGVAENPTAFPGQYEGYSGYAVLC